MYLNRLSNSPWSDAVAEPGSGGDSRDAEPARHARGFACRRVLVLIAATILTSVLAIAPVYADTDIDGDGVPDSVDNCPSDPNLDQADTDSDGVGDACDNAPGDANPGQEDLDSDGVGDVADNCPADPNPEQGDNEEDGIGDVCDPDDDNDGILDGADNCNLDGNPDQLDDDFDGLGNACDMMFNEDIVLEYMVTNITSAVAIIIDANPPGGNGLIAKLTSKGGVLRKVSSAEMAFRAGLIDLATYVGELESALEKLDAFDNQLSAKMSNGQISEDDGLMLEDASDAIRETIESLIANAGA